MYLIDVLKSNVDVKICKECVCRCLHFGTRLGSTVLSIETQRLQCFQKSLNLPVKQKLLELKHHGLRISILHFVIEDLIIKLCQFHLAWFYQCELMSKLVWMNGRGRNVCAGTEIFHCRPVSFVFALSFICICIFPFSKMM